MFVVLILSILFLLTKKAFNSTFFDSKSIPSTRNIDSLTKELIRTRKNGRVEVQKIDAYLFTRLAALVLIFSGLINFNFYYIQSIGLSLGIFSGLFYVNHTSILIESLIYMVGGLILFSWRPKNRVAVSSTHLVSSTIESDVQLWEELPGKVLLESKYYSDNTEKIDYSLIVLFSALGSSLLISSGDLISLYLSIELQSFSLYVLATLYKNSESSTSAGLKYFLLGGLSSCIILLGAGLIYSNCGLTNFESIYSLNSVLIQVSGSAYAENLTFDSMQIRSGIDLGYLLIFVGLLFKISAAPMHHWAPDVYQDTPTIVTTWLTIIPKLAIIILLLELFLPLFPPDIKLNTLLDIMPASSTGEQGLTAGVNKINSYFSTYSEVQGIFLNPFLIKMMNFWGYNDINYFNTDLISAYGSSSFSPANGNASLEQTKEDVSVGLLTLLFVSSALSLIIGTVLGLAQTKIKRLLAYSTISHIGFILLALGVKSSDSIESLIFYIIQYTITNLNIFLILITLSLIYSKIQNNKGSAQVGILKENNFDLGAHTGSSFPSAVVAERTASCAYAENGEGEDIKWISQLKGLYFINPYLSFSLIISLLSLTGIPPLLGFYAKQFTLYAALESGHYFLAVLAIVTSVISASYYLKIIRLNFSTETNVYYKDPKEETTVENMSESTGEVISWPCSEGTPTDSSTSESEKGILPYPISYFISFFTLFILIYAIKPSIISSSTGVLSLYLLGFLH